MENIKKFAKENFVPIVRDKTGQLLVDKIKEIQPKNILEIGTAIGYSGTLMLKNCGGNLTTLDINEERMEMAKDIFAKEGLTDRVNLMLGDALEIIPMLSLKFDFIFLDGPKAHYYEYLPYLVNLLNDGGMIFADNISYFGQVFKDIPTEKVHRRNRTIVRNLRKYLADLKEYKCLDSKYYDLEDGVMISIKKDCL